MIVLARVDDRLIHGQVVVGWLNAVKANHIIVINDTVARDKIQTSIMKMAVPPSIKTSFLTIETAIEKLNLKNMEKNRIILLFSNPHDVIPIVNSGIVIKSLNIGGMRFSEGRKEVLKSIFISNQDIEDFKILSSRGVHIEGKILPNDQPVDIMSIIG